MFGFDDPALGDPGGLRAEVAANRAKACRVQSLPDDVALQISMDGLPKRPDGTTVTWDEQLASTVGKRAAFLQVAQALQRIVIENSDTKCPQSVTITPPFGGADGTQGPWHYPFDSSGPFLPLLTAQRYGEAEAQIALCAKHIVYRSLQTSVDVPKWAWISIDTDAFIQSLGFPPLNGTLVVGRGYMLNKVVYATETAAAKAALLGPKRRKMTPQKVWRHYDMNKFMTDVLQGQSAARFARSQLLMMCAAGVDYCSGLGRFGWTSTQLLDGISESTRALVCGSGAEMHVDVNALRSLLSRTRRSRRDNANVAGLTQSFPELSSACGTTAGRPPATRFIGRTRLTTLA